MAAELPPDILSEILSRLPVKSLLRFQSTSKSLKSLIDSHKFINLHLRNSLDFNLILRHNTTDFYQLHFPKLTKSIIPFNDPFTTNIDPFTRDPTDLPRNSKMALIGSCNGLLAISTGVIVFTHPNNLNEITIWNPNTRKHRIIPFLPLPIPILNYDDDKCSLCVHGFGFDQITGDYKLLRISHLVDPQNPFYDPQVRLFSFKTNSWKIIPAMPYDLQHFYDLGVFVENSIHWIMTKKKFGGLHPCLIVAFNLTLEIFNEVPLPDEIGEEVNGESFDVHVAVLGECLCITVDYKTKIDVWVMKEYGCRDSWCKLFTMAELCFDLPLKLLRPICYSSDGSKVLLERVHVLLEVQHRKLFWYDLKSEQISYVEGIPRNMNETMFCVGSLVPPSLPVDNRRKKENHASKRRYFLLFN